MSLLLIIVCVRSLHVAVAGGMPASGGARTAGEYGSSAAARGEVG